MFSSKTSTSGGGDDFTDIRSATLRDDNIPLQNATTINEARLRLELLRPSQYLQDFDEQTQRDSRILGSFPAEVIDEGNRAQLLAQGVEKEDEELRHRNDIQQIDALTQRRLAALERSRNQRLQQDKQSLKELEIKKRLARDLMKSYFSQAKRELNIHLTSHAAHTQQHYGDLRKYSRKDYDPDKPDWGSYYQQVEFNITSVRGLKNKIPQGEYILIISKWEKLAGNPMKWSLRNADSEPPAPCPIHADGTAPVEVRRHCEICQGWAGGTMPVQHNGGPCDYALPLDARIFTFFPSQNRIKPYMSLIFELVRLPRNRVGGPQVVGWGAIPCVDSRFAVINGYFRLPLLRGPYKPEFIHHIMIQNEISEDLENWLGNIYLSVYAHPREHYGQNEFSLQREQTKDALGLHEFPTADEEEGWVVADRIHRGQSFLQDMQFNSDNATTPTTTPRGGIRNRRRGSVGSTASSASVFRRLPGVAFPYDRPEDYPIDEDSQARTRWAIIRCAVLDPQVVKRRRILKKQRQVARDTDEQSKFRFTVMPPGSVTLDSLWEIQTEYCWRAIRDELSLRHPKQPRFYLNIFAFFVALYFQVYMHSVFLYFAVSAIGAPVTSATPKPYGLIIDYSYLNTTAFQEFFAVFLAEFAMFALLAWLVLLGLAGKVFVGQVPDYLSKFVFLLGIAAFVVPVVELVVDEATKERNCDIYRLMDYFELQRYGMGFGIVIFLVVYFFVLSSSFVLIFTYTMRLHLNGILQDSYWRILIANEDNCVVPDDLEMSPQELQFVLSGAEQWRGKNGERRKIAVFNLLTTDTYDDTYRRVDQHIVVSTIACMDSSEYWRHRPHKIYREFYVMNDGKIIEVVDKKAPNAMAHALAAVEGIFKRAKSRRQLQEEENDEHDGDDAGAAVGGSSNVDHNEEEEEEGKEEEEEGAEQKE